MRRFFGVAYGRAGLFSVCAVGGAPYVLVCRRCVCCQSRPRSPVSLPMVVCVLLFFLSFFLLFLFVDDAVVAEDSQELSMY